MNPLVKDPQASIPCTFIEYSHVPKIIKLFYQTKDQGLGVMVKKMFKKVLLKFKILKKSAPNIKTYPDEVLDLKAGEWVRVRSKAAIQKTLNAAQRFKGLYLMPEMWKFCGKTFRVYKRLDSMMVESTGQIINMKNTVLLEGVHCDGGGRACDASCFHFWREIWLTRTKGPGRTTKRKR